MWNENLRKSPNCLICLVNKPKAKHSQFQIHNDMKASGTFDLKIGSNNESILTTTYCFCATLHHVISALLYSGKGHVFLKDTHASPSLSFLSCHCDAVFSSGHLAADTHREKESIKQSNYLLSPWTYWIMITMQPSLEIH